MKFKWTIEVEVDEVLVADGFNLDDRRANDVFLKACPHAFSHEIKAKVISAPDPEEIKKVA